MKISASTLLRVALCASAVSALSIPITHVQHPRVAPDKGIDVSFSGTFVNGKLVAGKAPTTPESQPLQKRRQRRDHAAASLLVDRQLLLVDMTVLTFVGSAVAVALIGAATKDAYEAVKKMAKDLSMWNDARETFSSTAVARMWADNPDPVGFPAAICYNKAYEMTNPTGFSAKGSVTLKVGVLHTDYDCLLMAAGNIFTPKSDGGFINLHYKYDNVKCTNEAETGKLICKL